MKYINLYLQSEYSFLQSTIKIKNLIKFGKENNVKALAITDDNMYGVCKFYSECIKNDIKPIIGLKIKCHYQNTYFDVLVYAKNNYGYNELLVLSSTLKIKNFITLDVLKKYSTNLIIVLPINDYNNLYLYNQVSFNNDTYIGLLKQNFLNNEEYLKTINYINQNNLKALPLSKVNCINSSETKAINFLNKLNKSELTNIPNPLFKDEDFVNLFKDYPNLLLNNEKIINDCNVTLSFDKYYFPKYKTIDDSFVDSLEYLRSLSLKGLQKRLLNTNKNAHAYLDRLNYELDVINKMGFNDYFLIIWDLIKFAKKEKIMVGPGRGSAVASLVSYSLGITDIDPLEYGLIFERFLNLERVSMPDIDIDFQDDRREEVIKYCQSRYKDDHVAQIITFSSYGAKQALNDVSNALQLSEVRVNQINKYLLPLIENDYSIKEAIDSSNELKALMNYQDIKDVLEISSVIEGLPKNKSTHASGVVVAPDKLVKYVPVEKGLQDLLQTQYSGTDLEKLGLLKIDFLGLHNLSVLSKCINLIKENNPDFALPKEFNDKATYELLSNGLTQGIFQLEKTSMKNTLKKISINSFNDLIQALALNRPGTMDLIPLYADRKFGKEKITYLNKDLEPILKETLGIILYQEQILQIAVKFAGFSYGRADILRRAVSKKNKELMESMKEEFINGSIKNGYLETEATKIFNYIEEFANYGFNKCHSVAYSYVAYIQAFLKTNYPAEFYATMFDDATGDDEKISFFYKEALSRNIIIHMPHLKYSKDICRVKNGQILLGLNFIKGINSNIIKSLLNLTDVNNYSDFVIKTKDFMTLKEIEKLIYSSCLDCFDLTKKAMIESYQALLSREKYLHIKSLKPLEYTNEEYSYDILLEKEKSVFGFNIKYNFFNQYAYLYPKYNLKKIKDLTFIPGRNNFVSTMGIIEQIREIKTKKDETMAFGTISDDLNEMEIVLFPRVYDSLNLEINKIYILNGEIQNQNNILQLVVNRIEKI